VDQVVVRIKEVLAGVVQALLEQWALMLTMQVVVALESHRRSQAPLFGMLAVVAVAQVGVSLPVQAEMVAEEMAEATRLVLREPSTLVVVVALVEVATALVALARLELSF
jgi:hypothetical protein